MGRDFHWWVGKIVHDHNLRRAVLEGKYLLTGFEQACHSDLVVFHRYNDRQVRECQLARSHSTPARNGRNGKRCEKRHCFLPIFTLVSRRSIKSENWVRSPYASILHDFVHPGHCRIHEIFCSRWWSTMANIHGTTISNTISSITPHQPTTPSLNSLL